MKTLCTILTALVCLGANAAVIHWFSDEPATATVNSNEVFVAERPSPHGYVSFDFSTLQDNLTQTTLELYGSGFSITTNGVHYTVYLTNGVGVTANYVSNIANISFITNLFVTQAYITNLTVVETNTVNYQITTNLITYQTNIANYQITTNLITYQTNIANYIITTNIDVIQNITVNSNIVVLQTNINNVSIVTNYITAKTAYITNLVVVSLQGVKGYIVLASPFSCDGTGTKIYTNDNTKTYFGQAQFNNAADKAANYCDYFITVPEDFDSAVDWKVERWKFQLAGADTGTHRYVISLSSVADSAAYAGSLGQPINLDFAGDASGASGDVETVLNVTLTAWKSNMTKGQLLVIRVARDGDDAADGSTVDSYSGPLVLSYGVAQ